MCCTHGLYRPNAWEVALLKVVTLVIMHFRKTAKTTLSFVMSVCLSGRVQLLCSHWTDFHEILYLRIFRKGTSKFHYILTRLTGTLYEDLCTLSLE